MSPWTPRWNSIPLVVSTCSSGAVCRLSLVVPSFSNDCPQDYQDYPSQGHSDNIPHLVALEGGGWGHVWDWRRGLGDVLTNDLQFQGLASWGPGVPYIIKTTIVPSGVFTHCTKVEPSCCLRRRGVYHIYDSEMFLLQAEPLKPHRAPACDDNRYPSR